MKFRIQMDGNGKFRIQRKRGWFYHWETLCVYHPMPLIFHPDQMMDRWMQEVVEKAKFNNLSRRFDRNYYTPIILDEVETAVKLVTAYEAAETQARRATEWQTIIEEEV